MLLRTIGDTDCELLGPGWLAQPVNAVTSLAFVGVALGIVGRTFGRDVDRVRSLVFAACLAAIGVGSALFHGPQPVGARFVHDLPILLTVLFVVVQDLRLLGRVGNDLAAFAVLAVAATVASALSADLGTVLTGIGILAVALLESLVFRRRTRRLDDRRQIRAYAAIIGLASVGVAAWVLGRTGSPVCDPDGTLQFHGLWHVISSLVLGMWWWLAMWLPSRPAAPVTRTRPDAFSSGRARGAVGRSGGSSPGRCRGSGPG